MTTFTNIILTRNGHLMKAMLFHQSNNAFTPIVELVRAINKSSAFPVCEPIETIAADPHKPISKLIHEINIEIEPAGYVINSTLVEANDTIPDQPTMF